MRASQSPISGASGVRSLAISLLLEIYVETCWIDFSFFMLVAEKRTARPGQHRPFGCLASTTAWGRTKPSKRNAGSPGPLPASPSPFIPIARRRCRCRFRKYSLTYPLQSCSCSVHVRPARRCRPTQPPIPTRIGRPPARRTQPHRAPPHHRPHADRLRPAPGRRAATTHLRDRPRRHHAALRHHRHRRNPRAHHPWPASRRRARGQADQPPHPRAGHTATLTAPSPRQPRAAQPEDGAPPQPNHVSPACPRPGTSRPRSAAARSAPSSPISVATSGSCRATRCGGNSPWPSSATAAISPPCSRTSSIGTASADPPPAAAQPAGPAPNLPSPVVPGTGPP